MRFIQLLSSLHLLKTSLISLFRPVLSFIGSVISEEDERQAYDTLLFFLQLLPVLASRVVSH